MARGSENFLGDGINGGGTHRTRCGGFTGGRSQGSFSCECYNDELLSKILVNFCEAFRLSYPPDQQAVFQGLSVYGPCAVIAWMAFTTPDRLLYRSSGASPESSRAAWLGTASSCCGLFCFQGARCFSIDGLILSPALFCSVKITDRKSTRLNSSHR